MFRMYDLIEKKKNKEELKEEEIAYIVSGFTRGEILDYQMSAFLMAVYFCGMTKKETFLLTQKMKESGDVLDLSGISGIKVDKHSTGGVGDKTTLVLAPMIASLGVPVAKMSGRGLGHTGGTIDKLEAFPGFMTSLPEEKFISNVNQYKIAVAGQTKNLAPADKKIYALRDATACVNSIPLIASSIMSKKLASGADGICLDVKVGSGAFMKTIDDATLLAKTMVDIGRAADKKMVAVLTNMDEPLGCAVGNTLEVMEAIDSLRGNGPKDFMEVVFALGSEMLMMAEVCQSKEQAIKMLSSTISDGSALETFKTFVEIQGGNRQDVDHMEDLLDISCKKEVISLEEGYVSSIEAEQIGNASMLLGGGRASKEDTIDLSVGVILHKKVGDKVQKNESIATIYGNSRDLVEIAIKKVRDAYTFRKEKTMPNQMVLKIIK
ncbi:MAG: pyrimidine-nucleoside phosphorylase [Lachnospiraceae bacterium]|nr:pyrimidine-nucleoside phosphorylase [Lachnospiraceae bacterium]